MKPIVLVVFLGLALRFIGLPDYPSGFSADEVNQGYTAYSILKTGRDEWGNLLPVAPRSYGDFRAPLYTYLTVPSIAVFGLNEFAVRFPAVMAGTLAIFVTYLLCKELFGGIIKGKYSALWPAFLLAVSPWHIALSRGAFEPNLPTLLIPAGALFFLKGRKRKGYMLLSVLLFGLGLFSYYSARVLVPVVLVLLYLLFVRGEEKIVSFLGKYKLAVILMFLVFVIAGYTMLVGSSTRVADVSIINESSWGAVSEKRYDAVLLGSDDSLARIFNNKVSYVVRLFAANYLDYFSLNFLFSEGASEATYGMAPGFALLYLVEIIFILFAFYHFVSEGLYKRRPALFVLAVLLLAPTSAALTTGLGMAANRAALMMPWIQIVSGMGAYLLIRRLPRIWMVVLAVYFVIAVSAFMHDYFFRMPKENSRAMSYGWRQASEYLKKAGPLYGEIVISKGFSEPQMFVAFYLGFDPLIVQQESVDWLRYEKEGLKFVDQLGKYRLGKFVFRHIESSDFESGQILIMGRPDEFKNREVAPDYVVYYPDGEPAIYFVASREAYAKKI